MYSTDNEEKSVVAERFIRTIKNKIYKYMTSISKSVYIDKLDDVVNKSHKNHNIITQVKWNLLKTHLLTLVKKFMIKILNLKLVIFLEYHNIKNIFAKGYVPNWSEKDFVIKKVKNSVPWTYVISDLDIKEIVGTF